MKLLLEGYVFSSVTLIMIIIKRSLYMQYTE